MISSIDIVGRLLLGALLGGIIGFERQTHGRPAGFRTHLLVCVASVLIMTVSEYYHFLSMNDPSYIRIDPARLAAGAITGVGFLGAGVIIKTGMTVQGLTTAACLWIVSAIGLAVGSGLYLAAVASFAITYFTLWTLRLVEKKMTSLIYRLVTIVARSDCDADAITAEVEKCGAHVSKADYQVDKDRQEMVLDLTISFRDNATVRKILSGLSAVGDVRKIAIRS